MTIFRVQTLTGNHVKDGFEIFGTFVQANGFILGFGRAVPERQFLEWNAARAASAEVG